MAEPDQNVCAHVIVHGHVQGVWFRGSACREARALGLTGWVRNRPDGTVEAVFEGPRGPVARMVGWCHQGPRSAQVTRVELQWQEPAGRHTGFDVTY